MITITVQDFIIFLSVFFYPSIPIFSTFSSIGP